MAGRQKSSMRLSTRWQPCPLYSATGKPRDTLGVAPLIEGIEMGALLGDKAYDPQLDHRRT
ncbi:MAG: hypothetical protein U5K75_09360 [Ahrensia sp.]|nr:hypothetical protein [Ahrensia sp.]